MTDTQKRIEAYQNLLPGIQEKVVAVAFLLALSIIMLTSASFAWLTISRAPEVSAVTTNIASNGSLEIALVKPDGSVPGESQVGDSMAATPKGEENKIVSANTTWGNLINLSDPSYGLENLVLRPAKINTVNVMEYPLEGAEYSVDGRIIKMNSEFDYAIWDKSEFNPDGYFLVSDKVGVRTIASVKEDTTSGENILYSKTNNIRNLNATAVNTYLSLAKKELGYMDALANMMGLYMTATLNPNSDKYSDPDCPVDDIRKLMEMYTKFAEAFEAEADAMAELINLKLYLKNGDDYVRVEKNDILKATGDKLADYSEIIGGNDYKNLVDNTSNSLAKFIEDYNTIKNDITTLEDICNTTANTVKFSESGLEDIVNKLVNISTCTIGDDDTPISQVSVDKAMDYMNGKQKARITNGVLYRFEERTGAHIDVEVSIRATLYRPDVVAFPLSASVTAAIKTTAPENYSIFNDDLEKVLGSSEIDVDLIAKDTYALVVDLWVRTNSANSYLTLEGEAKTETNTVNVTATTSDGTIVNVKRVTISGTNESGEPFTYDRDLYKHEENWYDAITHSQLSDEEIEQLDPDNNAEDVTKEVISVTGYEGENRVWDDILIDGTGKYTTQGLGSCYVYYADNPEDQAKSLKLLNALKVAFVDVESGNLLCTAVMDTEKYYAESGKVTVPLVLNTGDSINLGTDEHGVTTYGITMLEQNVPTRITAIVYLDGTNLTNEDVLSNADIQGKLNIQFGNSAPLEPIKDQNLSNDKRTVSAVIDNSYFDYDEATEPMTTNVTLTVEGSSPGTVTACFIREVSSTQGSREEIMTFTKNDEGKWVSSHTFEKPGKYVLRDVQLDGQDYPLATAQVVTVDGFAITSFSCTQSSGSSIYVMTEKSSYSVDFELEFATNDPKKMPKKVVGKFIRSDGNVVNIHFSYNATSSEWIGKATFSSSGEYDLDYIVVDEELYIELDEAFKRKATLYLGMRAEVYTTSETNFVEGDYDIDEFDVSVKIIDDTGEEIKGLTNLTLFYSMKGNPKNLMSGEIKWNGTSYDGTLPYQGPGTWQFTNVTIGLEGEKRNTISTAARAPEFTIIPKDPPVYIGTSVRQYYYTPTDGDANMIVRFHNTDSASITAKFTYKGTELKVVGRPSQKESYDEWTFTIRDEGIWTLEELHLSGVFIEGKKYESEEPYVLYISEVDENASDFWTKVVTKANIEFNEDKTRHFGKTELKETGDITGVFMDKYTIPALTVTIKDFEGEKIPNVKDVKLTYTWSNSKKYGGYEFANLQTVVDPIVLDFTTIEGNEIEFTCGQQNDILYLAGIYTPVFTYKVGSSETTVPLSGSNLPKNTPVFTVSSIKPSVKITGVSPKDEIYTKLTWTTNFLGTPTFTATDSNTNSFSDYAATVYASATVDNSLVGNRHGFFAEPSITITVYGVADGYAVSLTLPADTATEAVEFSRTGNGAINKDIGTVSKIKYFGAGNRHYLEGYTGHGNVSITTMTLTKDNTTYTVTLDNPLTINNPSSVNQTR